MNKIVLPSYIIFGDAELDIEIEVHYTNGIGIEVHRVLINGDTVTLSDEQLEVIELELDYISRGV